MKNHKTNCAGFLWYLLNFSLFVLCLNLMSIQLSKAEDIDDLFSAEVTLDNKANNPLENAYKEALNVVLTKISHSDFSANKEAVKKLFPIPSAYVNQFRPSIDDKLRVSFDAEAIQDILRNAGYIVWGEDRPLTLIWLAVDWGQGEREIISDGNVDLTIEPSHSIDRSRLLYRRISEIADERGIPIVFPLRDTIDLRNLTFSDIWGGFDEQVIKVSDRYKVDSILIGRIRPHTNLSNRWSYFFEGKKWVWADPSEEVISEIADILAAEFAVGGNAVLENVVLNISGIDTLIDFGLLKTLLSEISLIEDFMVLEVSGNKVKYRVKVRGGVKRLRRVLNLTAQLKQVDTNIRSDLESMNELEFNLIDN